MEDADRGHQGERFADATEYSPSEPTPRELKRATVSADEEVTRLSELLNGTLEEPGYGHGV